MVHNRMSKDNKLSLRDFKRIYGRPALGQLASDVGSSVKYFDSYTTDNPRRKPSLAMCKKILAVNSENFSMASLRPDFFE